MVDAHPKMPLVHLAIDIQDEFLNKPEYLARNSERAHNIPRNERMLADELAKKGIPTIWVVYADHENGFLPADSNPEEYKKRGLSVEVKPGERVYLKSENGAFFAGDAANKDSAPLAEYLRAQGTHTIVESGINSGRCAAETAVGAMLEQFKVHALIDHMADVFAEQKQVSSPELQHQLIAEKVHTILNALKTLPDATGLEQLASRQIAHPQIVLQTSADFLAEAPQLMLESQPSNLKPRSDLHMNYAMYLATGKTTKTTAPPTSELPLAKEPASASSKPDHSTAMGRHIYGIDGKNPTVGAISAAMQKPGPLLQP